MKRVTINVEDPFLDVEMVPLVIPGGQKSSRCAVILDPGGSRTEVGVVSRDYRLIPNLEVRNIALDILTRTGLPFEERQMLFDDRRYMQRWTIPAFEVEPREGDFIRLGLQVHNSYDGSTQFCLAFIAERLVCRNGMVVDFLLGGFRFRHYGENGTFQREFDQALDTINQLDDRGEKLLPAMQRMVTTPTDRHSCQQTFQELKLPKSYIADVYMAIEEDTVWGLYNAFTRTFSRLGSFRGEALNRQASHYFFVERIE